MNAKGAGLGGRFWRVLTASGASNLADGIAKTAVPLIAIRFTESPLAIGGLTFALTLPWLLLALPAGALTDRWDRRKILLASNSARAAVAGLLAIALALGLGSMPVLYAAALMVGIAEVLYDTASQTILPQVVDRPRLTAANARLYGVEIVANQLVGPPLGGLLVGAASVGAVLAMGTPAATWAIAVVVLVGLSGNFRITRDGPATSIRADIAEGMRYLARHRVLRMLALMTGVSNFGFSMMFAVFVLYAVGPASPMGLTDAGFGLLSSSLAVGAIAGSLFANALVKRVKRHAALSISMATMIAQMVTVSVTANVWAIGAAWVVAGMGLMVWNVTAVSLRQQVTPDRLLGRVHAAYRTIAWGVQPIAALAGGALGQAAGLRPVFWVATALAAITALGLLEVTNPNIEAAEAAAAAQAN